MFYFEVPPYLATTMLVTDFYHLVTKYHNRHQHDFSRRYGYSNVGDFSVRMVTFEIGHQDLKMCHQHLCSQPVPAGLSVILPAMSASNSASISSSSALRFLYEEDMTSLASHFPIERWWTASKKTALNRWVYFGIFPAGGSQVITFSMYTMHLVTAFSIRFIIA